MSLKGENCVRLSVKSFSCSRDHTSGNVSSVLFTTARSARQKGCGKHVTIQGDERMPKYEAVIGLMLSFVGHSIPCGK